MKSISQPEIQIRPASKGDINSLTNLLRILFTLEEDFTFNKIRQQRGLKLMLENSTSCILVAQINGLVVGMCSGQVMISTSEGAPALWLEDVIVEEKWRGLGIGRKLLDAIAQWGKGCKAYRMQLLTDNHNRDALSFYTKLNWQTTKLVCMRKRQRI